MHLLVVACSRDRVIAGTDAGGMLSHDVLLQEFGGGEHFTTGQARLHASMIFVGPRWSPSSGRRRQGQKLLVSAFAPSQR